MRCVRCGEALTEGEGFCRYCGTSSAVAAPTCLQSAARCFSCGTRLDLDAGDRFCARCGADVLSRARTSEYWHASAADELDQDWPAAGSARHRPTAITVICILGFIGAVLTIPLYVLVAALPGIGSWYLPYLGFSMIVGLACMIGLWLMKKWAAYTYTGFFVANQVVLIAVGAWSVASLVIPAVVVIIALKYSPRMT